MVQEQQAWVYNTTAGAKEIPQLRNNTLSLADTSYYYCTSRSVRRAFSIKVIEA